MRQVILAVGLCMSVPAIAQNKIEFYGILDAGLVHHQQKITHQNKIEKHTKTGFQDSTRSGTRWGLRGQERLNSDLNATFQLEGGFNLSQGQSTQGGRLFGRQATLGLAGKFGRLNMGRQTNLADNFVGILDPFEAGWGQATVAQTFGDAISYRYDASIKYITPSFSGLQLGLMLTPYSETEISDLTQKHKKKSHLFSLGGYYEHEYIQVGASYEKTYNKEEIYKDNKQKAKRKNAYSWNIGAVVTPHKLRYHLMYGKQRHGLVGDSAGLAGRLIDSDISPISGKEMYQKGLKLDAWLVGLSYPVTGYSNLYFSYQGNRLKNNRYAQGKAKTNIFSAAYLFQLSSRTALYSSVSYGRGKLTAKPHIEDTMRIRSTEITFGLNHRF